MVRSQTGSVMLEFIIVLPIYFALFGGVFAVGDMLVRAIGLTYADRLRAMEHGETGAAQGRIARAIQNELLPTFQFEDDNVQQSVTSDVISPVGKTHRADEKFKAAWSWQVAGKVSDSYKAPPWTRAWIGFPTRQFESAVSDGAAAAANAVKGLADKLEDVVTIMSMDWSRPRAYNYYTLKRTEIGRSSSYRTWHPMNLTNVPIDYQKITSEDAIPVWGAGWLRNVYSEPFAVSDAAELDKSSQGADEAQEEPDWRTGYSRFPTFMLWSQ